MVSLVIRRPFLIDEIVLGSVAGSVSGMVLVDSQWGIISEVEPLEFDFHDRHSEQSVELGSERRRAVVRTALSVLEMEPDLGVSIAKLTLSASTRLLHLVDDSAGEETLAQFLAQPRASIDRHVADRDVADRDNDDRRISKAE